MREDSNGSSFKITYFWWLALCCPESAVVGTVDLSYNHALVAAGRHRGRMSDTPSY